MNPYGLIIPAALVATLIVLAYYQKGGAGVADGFLEGGSLFLKVLPNLAIGFTLAGFVALMLPQDMVAQWIGKDSGLRGLLVGTVAGAFTPGGPFTHFPILASLATKGAAIGPISAYIAAWALIGVHRIIIWEGPVLGWWFVLVRVSASALCPIVIGAIAGFIASFIPEDLLIKK
ncbi:MAG: hypothetical protein A2Z34_06410 [Planctomycetes bacterium RBG_16_59_8]|nr:MAG: hypothetical protein A2Z34_06410 [Planctomycetes bacterium RBG_16_59_8]